jgi:hypothetical protein
MALPEVGFFEGEFANTFRHKLNCWPLGNNTAAIKFPTFSLTAEIECHGPNRWKPL